MIDRQHGNIVIECDSCDATFESEQGEEFAVVWSAAKREGWSTRPIDDRVVGKKTWLHGCPKCGAPR